MSDLYHVIAYFNENGADVPVALSAAWNEHLGPGARGVILAGRLIASGGAVTAWMGVMQADSLDRVRQFMEASPYREAGLYSHFEISRLVLEVGHL